MSDLLGFVLQIYALIVQSSPTNLLKETYSIIYASILDIKNWINDNVAIFPAYCLYLETFVKKFPQKVIETAADLQKILIFVEYYSFLFIYFFNFLFSCLEINKKLYSLISAELFYNCLIGTLWSAVDGLITSSKAFFRFTIS